jgi:hypothetical protein
MRLKEALEFVQIDFTIELKFDICNSRTYNYNCKVSIDKEWLNYIVVAWKYDNNTFKCIIREPIKFKWQYCSKCSNIFKMGVTCSNCGNTYILPVKHIVIGNNKIEGFEEGD